MDEKSNLEHNPNISADSSSQNLPKDETAELQEKKPQGKPDPDKEKYFSLNSSEKVQSKERDIDYKRIGFMCCISPSANRDEEFKRVIEVIDENFNNEVASFESLKTLKIQKLEERISDYREQLQDKKQLRVEFEGELKQMREEKTSIENEISRLQDEKNQVVKSIGEGKENLIIKRLDEIEKEMNRVIHIHENIAIQQNPKLKDEFEENRGVDGERIALYKKIKNNLEETYDDVRNRIKNLNNAGINSQWAYLLVLIGWGCALVSGWFFSLWSGPVPEIHNGKGIIQNDSVRFLLIDLVAKYIKDKEWIEVIGGLLVYIFLVGAVGWLCYYMLKRSGFIVDSNALKDLKNKLESDDSYTLNPEEQDELFKGQFRANNWFALWLKVAPFIVFVYLTLAVISKKAFEDDAGVKIDRFQSVFDSLTNQFMGTLIAIAFAGLFSLYIVKVIEPRAIAKTKDEDSGRLFISWELVIGLLLFGVMLFSMIVAPVSSVEVSKYPIFYVVFEVSGLLFFSLVTGFTLGYGYRFIGLNELLLKLTVSLEIYSLFINRLSKPDRVNYLDDELFKGKMALLKTQMLNLVIQRNTIAERLTSVKEDETKKSHLPSLIYLSPAPEEALKEDNKKDLETPPKQKDDENSTGFLDRFKEWMSLNILWNKLFQKETHKFEEEAEGRKSEYSVITKDLEAYFPEFVSKIKELNALIDERKKRINELDSELNGYWHNEKTYRSINDQIKYIQGEITQLTNEIFKLGEELTLKKTDMKFELERKKSLVKEGFYNGLWFLKNGDDLASNYLPRA